ncbi:hypothetical protein P12x_006161 (plasmid) [Tundrisphaera lichenicola]|uniref:hypothetical protein n=1 Tax=Tundrisphaera lichenicola TaxID=2029860 RepID=UPI003EBF2D41
MPRRHRRRRPGRRPPDRHSQRSGRPLPGGFTPPGLDPLYRIAMPGLTGDRKREYFNGLTGWLVAGIAPGMAILGFSLFGPLGAILGLGFGLVAGGWSAEKGRFYRQ